ncbi:MAG: thiamine-phosphate kinase [Candidatus Gastranaerophilales bacterium]|nr:thiamine-phosphate kinase [Candidatus Gastranaerophilales bacterium]
MNREETFLNIISKTLTNSSFLGDDCAYLKEYNLAVSTDTLVQDVHFKYGAEAGAISSLELGKKALLVNISDILASGAKPEYLTVSLSGNLDKDFIEGFYKGADEICKEYDLKIIGGDLTGGDKISVSVTIFGSTKGRNVSSRSGAKNDYIVLLAGEHGSSAVGLSVLNTVNSDLFLAKETFKKAFIKAHIEPKLFPEISKTVATKCKKEYAMMDTSDGLYDAMKKISESSNVGFRINYDKIPKKNCVLEDDTIVPDFNTVLFGGEDFGLLICISREDFEAAKDELVSFGAVKIGTTAADKKILIDNKEINEDLRFEHFKK